VNCATGYTHQVEIYIRRGNGWRKSFSVFATSVIWLGVDFNDNDYDYLTLERWSSACTAAMTY
jgi:hypothetical protein